MDMQCRGEFIFADPVQFGEEHRAKETGRVLRKLISDEDSSRIEALEDGLGCHGMLCQFSYVSIVLVESFGAFNHWPQDERIS